MAPIKQGKYVYRPSSLLRVRRQLKLKQKEMAKLLEIPANTLSRWENGLTTPDADSLAAIYSLAKELEVTPEFFQRKKPSAKPTRHRSRLIVIWDFEDVGIQSFQLHEIASWLHAEFDNRFSKASYRLFKAFASTSQTEETDRLGDMGWRIIEDDEFLIDAIHDDAKSDCGQNPKDTTLVLIAKDENHVELVNELVGWGVRVYLVSPVNGYSEAWIRTVARRRWISLPEHYSAPVVIRVPKFIENLLPS